MTEELRQRYEWAGHVKTGYFPQITETLVNGLSSIFSTFVRIQRGGIWYRVLHIREFSSGHAKYYERDYWNSYRQLMMECYLTVYLYQLNDMEEVDPIQEDEDERLRKWKL